MILEVLPQALAVTKLDSTSVIPSWAVQGDFFSVTKTDEELSVVCREALIPKEIVAERGFRCFKVRGPLDFTLTGILASLAEPLARAKVSIFAISTFNTDYLLVKEKDLALALEVLLGEGHQIVEY
jgi:hypothetical protein